MSAPNLNGIGYFALVGLGFCLVAISAILGAMVGLVAAWAFGAEFWRLTAILASIFFVAIVALICWPVAADELRNRRSRRKRG